MRQAAQLAQSWTGLCALLEVCTSMSAVDSSMGPEATLPHFEQRRELGIPNFMAALPLDVHKAIRHLKRDPHLAPLIGQHGLPPLQPQSNTFRALTESIIYQQLSGKAAAATALYRGVPSIDWPVTSLAGHPSLTVIQLCELAEHL